MIEEKNFYQSNLKAVSMQFQQLLHIFSKVDSNPGLYPALQITEPESKHQTRYVSFPVWGGGGRG